MELNTIYNEDALTFLKKIDDESIDLIMTSPPYNVNFDNTGNLARKKLIDYEVVGDNKDEVEYTLFLNNILKECYRILKKTGSICFNHKPRMIDKKCVLPFKFFDNTGFILKQNIVWNRLNMNQPHKRLYYDYLEYIMWYVKTDDYKFNNDFRKYSTIWSFLPERNNSHPAPFPEELPKRCINALTDEGDVVLDMFMGSGTVGVVSKKLNRNYIGSDLNEKFIEMANKRIYNTDVDNKLKNYFGE